MLDLFFLLVYNDGTKGEKRMYSIKKMRGIAGVTQQELANYLGCSKAYISYLESNKITTIPEEELKKIADLFGCTIIELYGIDILKYRPQTYLETKQLILNIIKDSDLCNIEDKKSILKEVLEGISWV